MTTEAAATIAAKIKRVTPLAHITAPGVIELLGDVCRAYTRYHKDLKIAGAQMAGSIALSVQGHNGDHGQLVGESGNNIRSLNMVFTRIGRKMQQPILLELQDPIVGKRENRREFKPDANFKHAWVTALLTRVLQHVLKFPFKLSVADVGTTTFYEIMPADEELPIVRGDLAKALHNLFHAIGKTHGRKINVSVVDPDAPPEPAKEPPPMAVAPPPPPVPGIPPATGLHPVEAERQADLDREVLLRGVSE